MEINNSGITPAVEPAAPAPATNNEPVKPVESGTTNQNIIGGGEPPVVTTPAPASAVEPTEAEKRIRQVIAQRNEEREKREREEREKEYWKGVAEGRKGIIPNDPASSNQNTPTAPVAPDISKFETFEEYEAAKETYLINKTKWEINQDAIKREQERKIQEEQNRRKQDMDRVAQNWQTKKMEGQAKYADFQTVISNPTFTQNGVMGFLIQGSNCADDLAYYLAKNPAEMQRLNSLPPYAAAKEVGVLEMKLTSKSAENRNVISQAPAPITPVIPGSTAEVDEDQLPIEEFVRRRNIKQGLIKG